MGEQKNLTQDNVLDLMRNFEIQPLFNKVVITLNREEEDGGLILSDNTLSEIQYVLASTIAVVVPSPAWSTCN